MPVHLLKVENKNSQPNNCGKVIIFSHRVEAPWHLA